MRALRSLLLLVMVVAIAMPYAADAARNRRAPVRTGVNDPRYAALIMNAKTGEVYHQQNADTRRYPASLTKMMTLYLLFEALDERKTSMSTRMRVSDYASVQPQTNISLTTQDKVPVDTAIKALVVRSANDVAVVVAEHLGGSVTNFGTMMTNKARALGMKNTVFKNPHGLPNSAQYTTARDMAKLGIALKRDFPEYYQYFSTRQFSWKGVTYYTHNRVMLRYSGTDGIKTGFINASGFNVVSSTVRGGRPLIGVVMGGASGQWRDNRMIQLLDAGYATLAKRGQSRGNVITQNLPTPTPAQQAAMKPAPAAPPRVVSTVQVAPVSADRGVIRTDVPPPAPAPVQVVAPVQPAPIISAPPAATVRPEIISPPVVAPTPAPVVIAPPVAPVAAPAPNTLDAQLAALNARRPATATTGPVISAPAAPADTSGAIWGIQVGAFSSRALAERAALQAYQLAQKNLQGARIAVLGTGTAGAQVHRARLENITEGQAKKACETLISNNSPCFIFRAGTL